MKIIARTIMKSASRIEVQVLEGQNEKILFFDSNRELWPQKPMSDDFIAVALCLYCANKQMDLYVDGTLTGSIIRNLDEFIKIWTVWKPELYSQIRIEAAQVVNEIPGQDKPSVLAFSGGVDACFTLAAHKTNLFGAMSRDIGLGVLMIGYDIQEYETIKYKLACESAEKILNHFNTDCAVISSNWREEFCTTRTSYPLGISSALHTLVNDYFCGIVANANNFLQDLSVNTNAWHLSVFHLQGSCTFPIYASGGTHTRMERVAFISKFPVIMNNLRVCWVALNEGINCGVCSKCVRTRLELITKNLECGFYNTSMDDKHIRQLEFDSYTTFCFMEEIFQEFDKNHPFYETVKLVYNREKAKLEESVCGLAYELDAKITEIESLRNEIKTIKNTKSYKLAAPFRLFKKS